MNFLLKQLDISNISILVYSKTFTKFIKLNTSFYLIYFSINNFLTVANKVIDIIFYIDLQIVHC